MSTCNYKWKYNYTDKL